MGQNNQQNQQLEVEVKFFAPSLPAVREKLLALGATLTVPRLYERNVIYDTPDFYLKNQLKLLRLRQDQRARLTFKGPAAAAQSLSEVKVREELEIEVSDFATAEKIVGQLGFLPQLVYEKYRETFQLGQIELVLDELPYGTFIELEGAEEEMRPLAEQLGLLWEKRLLSNYLALMAQVKSYYNLPFNDITFDNFTGREVDGAKLWG